MKASDSMQLDFDKLKLSFGEINKTSYEYLVRMIEDNGSKPGQLFKLFRQIFESGATSGWNARTRIDDGTLTDNVSGNPIRVT